jgi:hypothetical protein
MGLSFPARRVRRDAFCGGRASSPSFEISFQPSAISPQLFIGATNNAGITEKKLIVDN